MAKVPFIICFVKSYITRQFRNECFVSQHQLTNVATKTLQKLLILNQVINRNQEVEVRQWANY